jgi:4-amino-4-deoxy-L-arabinose transferase-like glycosyltransferase
MKIYDTRIPGSLWLILLVALGLRLLGAWNGNLMYDESTHLAVAETIDLHPSHFNLVMRSVDHPPMSVYLLRLSEYLFGDSNFGIRVLHALAGALTVIPVFLLAAKAFSVTAGLWAAALLAVDQFHMSWSYFAVPEVLLLFFTTFVLLQFMRATESRTRRDFMLAGLFLGLAYLAKETTLFLVPALWLTLLFTREQRTLVTDYRLYLMFLTAFLVASPDIVYNLVYFYEGYFYRDAGMISTSWHPSLRVIILYLGELAQRFLPEYAGFHGTGLQNPTIIHWPAGLLYLAASAAAFLNWRDSRTRLLLVTFLFVTFAFTALPDHGKEYTYWWASISLIPAVVLSGHLLARLQHRLALVQGHLIRGTGYALLALFASYLLVHAFQMGLRTGQGTPRISAVDRAERALQRAAAAENERDLSRQYLQLLHTLHIAGPHAGLYGYLARIAQTRNEPGKAAYYAGRSLALDPHNREALGVSGALERQIDE